MYFDKHEWMYGCDISIFK